MQTCTLLAHAHLADLLAALETCEQTIRVANAALILLLKLVSQQRALLIKG